MRKSVGALALAAVTALAWSPAAPAQEPDDPLAGVRFFSAQSPWNTPVQDATVDRRSTAMLREAKVRPAAVDLGTRVIVQPRTIEDGLYINTDRFTTPIYTDRDGSPVRIVCRQASCGPDEDRDRIVVPPDAAPDPRYDGWFTAIDLDERVAVDLWRARRAGDVISYQYIREWDLDGPGFGPPVEVDARRAVSARGSGLPLFAGVILASELREGRIEHALAISIPAPAERVYVQPASVTDGQGRSTAVPEGARLRLRSPDDLAASRAGGPARSDDEDDDANRTVEDLLFDVSINPLGLLPDDTKRLSRRSKRVILEALRTYGAIVVDRSAVPTLYAERNGDFDGLLRGDEVQSIDLEDFEVVTLGQRLEDPPPDVIVDPEFSDLQARATRAEEEAAAATERDPAGRGEFAP